MGDFERLYEKRTKEIRGDLYQTYMKLFYDEFAFRGKAFCTKTDKIVEVEIDFGKVTPFKFEEEPEEEYAVP